MSPIRKVLSLAFDGEWRRISYAFSARWHGLDLGYASLEELGLSEDRSRFHANSGGPRLEKVLNSLQIHETDAAIDMGCGKGGAILSMAKYPFCRVDGLDLSEPVIRVAKNNLRRMRISKATIYHVDAAVFSDLDRYTYVYLYHPFPAIVMTDVMRNLADSLKRTPLKITLIYRNPVYHPLVLKTGFRKVAEFSGPDHPTFVYAAAFD